MDNVKKNIGRIWKSKCKYLVIIVCGLIIMNGVNLLQTSLKFLNKKGEMVGEVKSVVITSETWESKGPGSWKVEKSADWTSYKKATIKFDVQTNRTKGSTGNGMDVILVLDNSGSMSSKVNGKQKLVRLKEDTISLTESLLSEENNRIAFIPFQSSVVSIVNFTNDKDKIVNTLNGMKASGGNNFVRAYEAVNSLLQDYRQEGNRELVMIFLTDGLNTPTEKAREQYAILKEKYDISISGIQYELGTKMSQAVIEISDVQYMADAINLKNIFGEITGLEAYEEFEITDYITEEFEVENISDIRVSRGEVKLETDEKRKQKVIWKIPTDEVKFITSGSATMEIDVIYKGELNPDRVLETNEKEAITVRLPRPGPNPGPEEIETEEVPRIRGGYYVIYDTNLPKECTSLNRELPTKRGYFPFETIEMPDTNYSCNGWQIKGWNFDEETNSSVTLVSDNKFIMPSHDVTITAVWAKIEVDKKMEGTVYEVPKKELIEVMRENAGTVNVDSSINFGAPSSASNGRGLYIRNGTQNTSKPVYYYRGNVRNNNVLFAGICWQIVRSTETRSVKLIYNGVSQDGRTCKNAGNSYIGSSNYYSNDKSLAYVGYMRGVNPTEETTKYEYKKASPSLDYRPNGTEITYDTSTGMYTLIKIDNSYDIISRYTFPYGHEKDTSYSSIEYFFIDSNCGSYPFYIELTGGATIESAIEEMFSNKYDSGVKSVIDSWYKTNIGDKGYTKYIDENTAWCNDRTIASGGFVKNSITSFPLNRNSTYYTATKTRKLNSTSANPSVKEATACTNVRDRLTTKNATTGSKSLNYPVGMLTADEVILSGMGYDTTVASTDSYLSTNYHYWTMTPFGFVSYYPSTCNQSIHSKMFYVYSTGSISDGNVSDTYNIRPTIALKLGTKVYTTEADGTIEHPYEVVVE